MLGGLFSSNFLTKLKAVFGKTKYQIKYLGSDVTLNTTLGDLTFNNLEIGKSYKVKLSAVFRQPAFGTYSVDLFCGAVGLITVDTRIPQYNAPLQVSGLWRQTDYAIFTATATVLQVQTSGLTGGMVVQGGGNRTGTYVILEEIPNHELTTQWN